MQKSRVFVTVIGLILVVASSAAPADLMDGLISLYRFEDASDLGKDETGNHSGTVMGTAPSDGQQLPGKVGKAMNFENDNGNFLW